MFLGQDSAIHGNFSQAIQKIVRQNTTSSVNIPIKANCGERITIQIQPGSLLPFGESHSLSHDEISAASSNISASRLVGWTFARSGLSFENK
jgi:hypothetical protein